MSVYRKYRPQNWASVIGQDALVTTLSNQVGKGSLSHAYLFSGPRGTGKTSTARILSKAINCLNRKEGDKEPCNECTVCRDITAGKCVDSLEIDAASHTGVDNVREVIIETTQFKPAYARYKTFIIDEVHMLSTAAFNALLKTLEEPPAHVVFILATTEAHKVPATILSRCEHYVFRRIPAPEMREKLEKIAKDMGVTVEDGVLKRIIRLSDGCMRDAESLFGQCAAASGDTISEASTVAVLPQTFDQTAGEFLVALCRGDKTALARHMAQFEERGVQWDHVMDSLLEYLRALLVASVTGSREPLEFLSLPKEIENELSGVPLQKLRVLCDTLITRRAHMRLSPIPQLPLELWIADHTDNAPTSQVTTQNASAPKLPPPAATSSAAPAPVSVSVPTPLAAAPSPAPAPTTFPEEKTPEPEITTEPKTTAETPLKMSTISALSLDEMNTLWQNCKGIVCERVPSLSFILDMSKVQSWDGRYLTLEFEYQLHKDKVMDLKNKKAIEETFKQHHDIELIVQGVLREKNAPVALENDMALDSLSAALGGHVE